MLISRLVGPVMKAIAAAALAAIVAATAHAEGVRSQAVVNLTFDEASGNPLDTAGAGAVRESATLAGGPARVRSHFPGQSGKRALYLDAALRQYVRIDDSADLDRADAVSISFFVAGLHPPGDAAFHGLIAKRDDAKSKGTNYGISFSPQSDAFQIYVNDTSGFKSAVYSAKDALGYRRPVFITAVLEVGDAPAPDADADRDDLLIRFYVNGKAIAPKAASGGTVAGTDVWLTDLNVAGLLNDAPLTLGASSPTTEFTSCFIDEFSLFAKALSPAEAEALFLEVAIPEIAPGTAAAPTPAAPEIRELSLHGLQSGQTTVLAISGANLQPAPELVVPFATERVSLRAGATAERLEFEVAAAASVPAGHYPLRVRTRYGISGALTIAVDPLPEVPYAESTPDQPVPLPVAISGTIGGQEQHRVYFAGKTGQRVIIDLESKRLGAAMDPVLELRNPRGAPLNIAWGRPQYRGDTRIEATLFADGIYSVDLHDLAYKAPGRNGYRLKMGDLKIIDTTFPPVVAPGAQQTVTAIGPGMDPATTLPIAVQDGIPGIAQAVNLPPTIGVVGPAPIVVVSEAVEAFETGQPEGQVQPIDARFAERPHVPVVMNGRISQPGETDRYLLQVTAGMTLRLSIESHGVHSPLDPRILVLSPADGSVLAASEEKPAVEFAVPSGMSQVEVAIRDLNRRGGADYIYRLRMIAAGQPDFSLSLDQERVALARDGTAIVRLEVNRSGYNGPIALSLTGAPELSVEPSEIPAGASKAFLRISARSADPAPEALIRRVRIVGQSSGLEPPLRRTALAPFDSGLSLVPAERAELTVALLPAGGAGIELASVPAVLFRGTDSAFPLLLNVPSSAAGQAVRLSLLTTEASRTAVDPTDPTRQRRVTLPLVRSLPEQTIPAGEEVALLRVAVPSDVAESQIDAVVRAEVVPNPFSDVVLARVYSIPVRLNVQSAVTIQPAATTLSLTGKGQAKLPGTLKRAAGFNEPVDVALVNLPAGYSAAKITLPPGQEAFEIVVTAPEVTAAADLPNVVLRVTSSAGNSLHPDLPIATKVAPAQP